MRPRNSRRRPNLRLQITNKRLWKKLAEAGAIVDVLADRILAALRRARDSADMYRALTAG